MIEQHDNSVIFRNVYENKIADISYIGMNGPEFKEIILNEPGHGFSIGDAIFYDFESEHYRRAIAVNSIMSEVIGVVSDIIDKDNFKLTLKGNIILDRYDPIETGSILYLSSAIAGRLTNTEPNHVSKIIAVKTEHGIEVNIQRGFYTNDSEEDIVTGLRYYTAQEIQDIITEIFDEIY